MIILGAARKRATPVAKLPYGGRFCRVVYAPL